MNKLQFIINALDDIPLVRDGKKGVAQLSSFHDDISIYKRFKKWAATKPFHEISILWSQYISMRNKEDFIPHIESENRTMYYLLFR